MKPNESKQTPCPTQMKKKCVNGFIMFCRMNRKQYIRWEGVLFSPDWGPTSLSIHRQSRPPTAADTFLSHALPASPGPVALVRARALQAGKLSSDLGKIGN